MPLTIIKSGFGLDTEIHIIVHLGIRIILLVIQSACFRNGKVVFIILLCLPVGT